MKRLPLWFLCGVAAAMLASAPAWGAASCTFRGSGLGLSFGTLDPSSGSAAVQPVVATTTFANMAGDCNPTNQTMTISISGSSSRQLVNSAGDTIAYSISGLPLVTSRPGNNNWTTWFGPGQISGSIAWSAYADAPAGLYQDTVTIVVNP